MNPNPVKPVPFLSIFFVVGILVLAAGCQTTNLRSNETALSAAPPATVGPVQTDSGRLVAELPFRLADDHIYLDVRVNQSRPLSFVLDTGSSTSVVSLPRAKELRLKQGFWKWKAGGWSGWVSARFLHEVTFKLGELEYRPHWLIVLPLPDDWWNPLDGIIGCDLFKRYVVEMDFQSHLVRLYQPKTYHYAGNGTVLPIKLRHGYPMIEGSVTGATGKPVRGWFEIDSGSGDVVALAESLVRTNKLTESGGRVLRTVSWNIAGQFPTLYGRIGKFQLGPYTLDHPTARFLVHRMVADKGQAGVIGTELLERFKVIFDYSRRHLILEPRDNFARPFPVRWRGEIMALSSEGLTLRVSGAELVARRPAFKQFRVEKIRQDSPADEAGLRVGDELIAIDGQPVTSTNLGQWMSLVDHEGQNCRVDLLRGGEKVNLQMKLEWLCFWDRL